MLLVRSGFDLDYVLDLDLLSFDSLVSSLDRAICFEKNEAAWTSLLAAQGGSKDMKKWAKRWDVQPRDPASQNDLGRFLTKFGGGF